MPKITKPDTHTGDDGTTSTIQGIRINKNAPLIQAFGSIDELNSAIGVVLASDELPKDIIQSLASIQNTLFHLGSDLDRHNSINEPSRLPQIEKKHISELNDLIKNIYKEVGPLKNFTHPGGSKTGARLHMARAICRRAERDVITLSHESKISSLVISYLNRLSDTLFMMARYENKRQNVSENIWDSHK